MNAILQVENLTKQYADFKLDHVSFSVPKGTIMGLIGENGAGKSTTINAILDLIHKDDGTVTFWGQELSSTKQIKEDVGVVFDGINFYETLTPAKVGKIAGAAYKQWDGHLFQDYNHSQKLLSFRYNIDTNRVEARFTDGSAVANRMPNCLRTSSTRYFTVGLTRRIECHRFFMATAENHCNVFCVTNWSSE